MCPCVPRHLAPSPIWLVLKSYKTIEQCENKIPRLCQRSIVVIQTVNYERLKEEGGLTMTRLTNDTAFSEILKRFISASMSRMTTHTVDTTINVEPKLNLIKQKVMSATALMDAPRFMMVRLSVVKYCS